MPTLSTIGAACARAWGFTSGLVKDQYFNLVSLLLPGNGTNGAQNNTFLDGSSNNFTITRNGNTTQGTFSPFSQTGWGNYFNGSSNYRLTIPDSTDLDIPGDFCLEMWAYFTSTSASNQLVCIGNENAAQNGFILYNSSATPSEISLYTNGATAIATSSAGITTNRWHHIALVRNGAGAGNTVIYVDGVSRGSAQITTSFTGLAGNGLSIGQTYNGSYVGVLNAYLSNVRLVNGSPVYTGAFTPPTTPLTAITNTKLLTCQSNRFVDANTQVAAKTITVTGSPSVTPFSPFAPTQSYSAAAVGGSGYFDGTGDYLTLAPGASFAFGTGDFTVECWLYAPSAPSGTGSYYSLDARNSGQTTNWAFGTNLTGSSSTMRIDWYTGSAVLQGSNAITGAWNHCVYTRTGTTYGLFVNGTRAATGTDSTNYNVSPTTSYIGSGHAGGPLNGYLSSVRVVKGTAVYDPTQSSITVPTAPLTAITNTSILLNFTNAGVVDATAKNVLETVGNAQISTSVTKFTGGSINLSSSGDYLKAAPSTLQDIAGGDFVLEGWFYFTSLAADRAMISKYGNSTETGGGIGYLLQYVPASNVLRLLLGNGSDNLYTWSWTPTTGVWYYVAVSRSGANGNAYIDGNKIGSTLTLVTNDVVSPNGVQIGKLHTAAQYLLGYASNVRITKGSARGYTGLTITVPSAPFPRQ